MREELSQIKAKIKELSAQINTPSEFFALPFHERSLMEEQLRSMEWYKRTLFKRCQHFVDA